MLRSSWKVWVFLVGSAVLVIGGAFAYLAWRQTVPGVRAELTPSPRAIGLRTPLTLTLRAARGGLVWTEIRLVQGQGHAVLANHAFPGNAGERRLDLVVEGKSLGLREGAATLEVRARDGFWRPLRADDRPVLSVPVTLDLTPPSLEVLASTRYPAQGGGGLVVFRARGASRVGVNVGGLFQPAYPVGPADGGMLAAMVALPWDFPDHHEHTAEARVVWGSGDQCAGSLQLTLVGSMRLLDGEHFLDRAAIADNGDSIHGNPYFRHRRHVRQGI